jgi:hypothetical protein
VHFVVTPLPLVLLSIRPEVLAQSANFVLFEFSFVVASICKC